MAFTTITVTCDYDLADGTDPAGEITFTPTQPMVNGTTVVAAPVVGKLDVDGILSIQLVANTDPGTVPTGTSYEVREDIGGAARTSWVVIPHGAGSPIDLSTLARIYAAPAAMAVRDETPGVPVEAQWLTALAAKQPLAAMLTRLAAAPVTVTYASSVTLNAALGCVFRVTATGDLTVSDITGGIDGQTVAVEVLASGADRTVTVTGGDAASVTSGSWWTGAFRYNATAAAWLMV